MHNLFLKQIDSFKLVIVPRFIELEIQKCALSHLNLRDMGQLRDRLEGQAYFNKLRNDVLAEYAFEKILGLTKFDWDKRKKKDFKRKEYIFEEKKMSLITFYGNNLPKIDQKHFTNIVFVYINPELRVYVSGLLNQSTFQKEEREEYDSKASHSTLTEYSKFDTLNQFSNLQEIKFLLS